MHDLALILHFLGLAMGLGTPIAFLFLGIQGSKMELPERRNFQRNTQTLSKMGKIGLLLLILSGLLLMRPYWNSLTSTPLLMIKLALVICLVIAIGAMHIAQGKRARTTDPTQQQSIERWGKISLITSLAIVILAVFIFH